MWPGQQPPGGEQNPQDPQPYPQQGPAQPGQPAQHHPYQQAGHPPQPNPYLQQPGYQQPNPYQQPTAQWAAPGTPGAPKPPDDGRKTKAVAIGAALAVLVAAGVTGFLVFGGDDGGGQAGGDPDPSPSASASRSPSPSQSAEESDGPDPDNPRAGNPAAEPVVEGWQTVVNPKRRNAFDVPSEWAVKSPTLGIGFEDENSKEEIPGAVTMMTGPAYYKEDSCTVGDDSYDLGAAGTKGAQGAKSLQNAAETAAEVWVYAAFDQGQTGTRKVTEATSFKSDHGIEGYTATATVTGVKKKNKCSSDGKAYTVAFTTEGGDYAVWCLYAAAGVDDELPDKTIEKIMKTLRPLKSS
ncbi:hypothetical protein [Streptomyces zingiberis]|uniref:DUF8017 domain-containing protein n=1 Tax=Streptomyces zingiberis TaxID=2053010 RepID=A0ABX1BWW4_9ACTN|nr:hypothetical protein [Streptomyces zingiberis]NJQ01583.1 hypothetical protein [Streptomyces zingiberis]